MKVGVRKPSIDKSVSARTSGRLTRMEKSAVNPIYGKKGMGWINNPKKAAYNKVYNKTTTSITSNEAGSMITGLAVLIMIGGILVGFALAYLKETLIIALAIAIDALICWFFYRIAITKAKNEEDLLKYKKQYKLYFVMGVIGIIGKSIYNMATK